MSRDYLNLCQTFYRRRNIYMSNDALVVGGTSPAAGTTPPAWWLNLDWKLSSDGTTQRQRSCHAFIWAPFRVFRVKFLTARYKNCQNCPIMPNIMRAHKLGYGDCVCFVLIAKCSDTDKFTWNMGQQLHTRLGLILPPALRSLTRAKSGGKDSKLSDGLNSIHFQCWLTLMPGF